MKKQFFNSITILALTSCLIFGSCRRNKDAEPTTTTNSQTVQAEDQNNVSDATNSVSDDADAVSSQNAFGGRMELACDLNVVTSSDSLNKTITYSGQCTGAKFSRTGTVKITLVPASAGKKWRDAGSKLVVNYQNVVVTRLSNGKSVTLNGTITHINATGGTRYYTTGYTTITHQVKGLLTAKFSDSLASTATWYITKKRQWNAASPNSYIVMGDSINLIYTNIAESGINRRGRPFVMTSPNGVTIKNCGTASAPYFRALGEVNHHFNAGTMSVKYGSDASGNLASDACSGEGYYINWANNLGVDKYTAFISY